MKAQREILAGEKGIAHGNISLFPVSAKQADGYEKNHQYNMYGTGTDNTKPVINQDYSFTELASMLTGKSYIPSAKGLAVSDAIEQRKNDYDSAVDRKASASELQYLLDDALDYTQFGYENKEAMWRDAKASVLSS